MRAILRTHERIIRQNPLLSLYFWVIGILDSLIMKANAIQAISLSLFLSYRIRTVEYFIFMANTGPRGNSNHQLEGMFKKVRPARPQPF
jgi:hypothetical protein